MSNFTARERWTSLALKRLELLSCPQIYTAKLPEICQTVSVLVDIWDIKNGGRSPECVNSAIIRLREPLNQWAESCSESELDEWVVLINSLERLIGWIENASEVLWQ